MRVIVTGGRKHLWPRVIQKVLMTVMPDVIYEGGQEGADRFARTVGLELGIDVITVHANWKKYGRRAGPIRNQRMLDEARPDRVLAFPLEDSVGTWDMVRRADQSGVRVDVYNLDGDVIAADLWAVAKAREDRNVGSVSLRPDGESTE